MDKPKFPEKGFYTQKDQAKSDRANKFIGRGSARSSTNTYRECWGTRANCGTYTQEDVVFISAEGARQGRIAPDFTEIGNACEAKATFITDRKADRERPYNLGEREVAAFLTASGYQETSPGTWTKTSTKH